MITPHAQQPKPVTAGTMLLVVTAVRGWNS